ncbi:hypothetical protein [Burkholderia cepacia]|uniref:hypothetical protein n=1 Tax=Burkholderia cepacia TaxID=292 RepID=UPI002AB7DE8A|nr:hypothetical protein [Burkholderia cepacia]
MAKAMVRSFVVNMLRGMLSRLSPDAGPVIGRRVQQAAVPLAPLHVPGATLGMSIRGHRVTVSSSRDKERHPFVKDELAGEVFEPGVGGRTGCLRIGQRHAYDVDGAIQRCLQWPNIRRMNPRQAMEEARRLIAGEVKRLEDWCAGEWWYLKIEIVVRDSQNKEIGRQTLSNIQSYQPDDYVLNEVQKVMSECMADVQRREYPASNWGM